MRFGVVTVGLFANRGADVALIGTPDGVKTIVNDLTGNLPVKKFSSLNLVTCVTLLPSNCRLL